MARDIVIVPSYYRPEYIALCLEYLAAADGAKEKEVWVGQDRHTNDGRYLTNELPAVRHVVDSFKLAGKFASITYIERAPTPYIGNPSNFLELYKQAYETDARYVYLVEDDVLVAPDFFRWHEAVQAKHDLLVSVGWHCVRNPEVKRSSNPAEYITSYRDFSSIGVCWKREKLAPLVKHARVEYYRDMAVYLRGAFPNNPFAAGQWTEQAGVITRLLHETRNRLVAWPSLRRCSHVGVHGYHRPHGHKFTGTLDERVAALRQAVASVSIQGMSKDFEDDIEPIITPGAWTPEQLHEVQHIPYVVGVY